MAIAVLAPLLAYGIGRRYWQTKSPALRAKDGHEALIAAHLTGDEKTTTDTLDRIAPALRGTHGPVQVRVGGIVAVRHEMQTTVKEELTAPR